MNQINETIEEYKEILEKCSENEVLCEVIEHELDLLLDEVEDA